MSHEKATSIHLLLEVEVLLGGGQNPANVPQVIEAMRRVWNAAAVGVSAGQSLIVDGDRAQLLPEESPAMQRALEQSLFSPEILREEKHILLPLIGIQAQQGILQIASPQLEPPSDVLHMIGRQLGIALENAERFRMMYRQATELDWLNKFGDSLLNLLSSLQIDEVVGRIMSAVKDMLEVEETSILLKDIETADLILWHYRPPERDLSFRLKSGQGIAGWVLETGEGARVNDVQQDKRWESTIDTGADFTTRSLLAMPIRLDDAIIGVVEAVNKIDGQFSEDDELLLETLAKWAAIAIGNANTFDELKRTHERLSDAKKQAAMAQMVLNLAHKINNSVGAIRVWAMEAYHELSGENFDTFELKALLGNIMANVGETLLMVRRIRSATEIAADDIEPVNIVEVLENAVRASRVHAGIQIERQYESDLPPVAAETERLVEVFLNLVNNAGDALGACGRITMSLHRTGSGAVEVGIQDNGDGIPEHLQPTVFDPFVTSKTDGLGLGLWMVKLYVELINGSINLNTAPGKGTTFRVTLPAWQGGRLEAWKTGVR